MKQKTFIAPSILSADFANMGRDVASIEKAGADMIHCDVMDGVFVPNISFGIKMIADLRPCTSLPLDVHLMIVEPERYVERFAAAGADYITVHYEATKDLKQTLTQIKSLGKKCGAVISPDTPDSVLYDLLPIMDMVLVMSVHPGFGGQKYIDSATQKLINLRREIDKTNREIRLEVDGGVTSDNIKMILDAGADTIVAGSTVFNAADKALAIKNLRNGL